MQLLLNDGRLNEQSRQFFQQMNAQLLQQHGPLSRDENLPSHDHWHHDDGSASD
jgi:hypothetical protein